MSKPNSGIRKRQRKVAEKKRRDKMNNAIGILKKCLDCDENYTKYDIIIKATKELQRLKSNEYPLPSHCHFLRQSNIQLANANTKLINYNTILSNSNRFNNQVTYPNYIPLTLSNTSSGPTFNSESSIPTMKTPLSNTNSEPPLSNTSSEPTLSNNSSEPTLSNTNSEPTLFNTSSGPTFFISKHLSNANANNKPNLINSNQNFTNNEYPFSNTSNELTFVNSGSNFFTNSSNGTTFSNKSFLPITRR